jgi:hypothetical protein
MNNIDQVNEIGWIRPIARVSRQRARYACRSDVVIDIVGREAECEAQEERVKGLGSVTQAERSGSGGGRCGGV